MLDPEDIPWLKDENFVEYEENIRHFYMSISTI